jgi:hypothetical protein
MNKDFFTHNFTVKRKKNILLVISDFKRKMYKTVLIFSFYRNQCFVFHEVEVYLLMILNNKHSDIILNFR